MSFEKGKQPGIYNEATLGRFYDILVETAGASGHHYERRSFVQCALNWDYRFSFEYRFQGLLQFGGKIWLPLDKAPYVSCYREDDSPERKEIIEKTNVLLEKAVKE
jgi:hypothetical protein